MSNRNLNDILVLLKVNKIIKSRTEINQSCYIYYNVNAKGSTMRCMALNPILTNIESSFHILVCWQFGHYLVIIFMKLNEILCNVIKLWFQKMAKIRDLLHDMKCCEMLLSEFKSRLPHQRNSIKFAFHCKLYRVIWFFI